MMAAPKAILFGAALMAPIIWRQDWKPKVAADFWVAVAVYTGGGAGCSSVVLKPRPVFSLGAPGDRLEPDPQRGGIGRGLWRWAAFWPNKDFFLGRLPGLDDGDAGS